MPILTTVCASICHSLARHRHRLCRRRISQDQQEEEISKERNQFQTFELFSLQPQVWDRVRKALCLLRHLHPFRLTETTRRRHRQVSTDSSTTHQPKRRQKRFNHVSRHLKTRLTIPTPSPLFPPLLPGCETPFPPTTPPSHLHTPPWCLRK